MQTLKTVSSFTFTVRFPIIELVLSTKSSQLVVGYETLRRAEEHAFAKCHVFFSDERNYECHLCDAKYKWSADWRKHLRSVHGDTSQFKCKTCGMAFNKHRDALHHRKEVHPNKCEKCDRSFERKGDLVMKSNLFYRHHLLMIDKKNFCCYLYLCYLCCYAERRHTLVTAAHYSCGSRSCNFNYDWEQLFRSDIRESGTRITSHI